MHIANSLTIVNIKYAISMDPGGSCNLTVQETFSIDFNGILQIDFFWKIVIKNDSNEVFEKFLLDMGPREEDPVRGKIKMKKVK